METDILVKHVAGPFNNGPRLVVYASTIPVDTTCAANLTARTAAPTPPGPVRRPNIASRTFCSLLLVQTLGLVGRLHPFKCLSIPRL